MKFAGSEVSEVSWHGFELVNLTNKNLRTEISRNDFEAH